MGSYNRFLAGAAMVLTAMSLDGQSAAERGGPIFLQQCGFCHGRDAGGGEDGPDLTRSKLVAADVSGD
jgi:mono/diheme cytochrome c family protein